MKLVYKNGHKVSGGIELTTPEKKGFSTAEVALLLSAELKALHDEKTHYRPHSNVFIRCPTEFRLRRTDSRFDEEMCIDMRLQSCEPKDDNSPLTFYGTANGPDPDLLGLSGITPFTDSQWQAWTDADNRLLLLQCPCVIENVIKDPEHEFAATYEYSATSLNVLGDELGLVVAELLGVK